MFFTFVSTVGSVRPASSTRAVHDLPSCGSECASCLNPFADEHNGMDCDLECDCDCSDCQDGDCDCCEQGCCLSD